MTFEKWQKHVDDWISEYGVRYFDIKTNTLLLSEEVGEFSSLIARVYGEQSFKKDRQPHEIKRDVASEMSDIIFVLTCLANQMGIDLASELKLNLKKKTDRDKHRHRDNQKLKG